jgi:hypothetical protein
MILSAADNKYNTSHIFLHCRLKINHVHASAFILGPITIKIYSKMSIPLVTDMLRKGTTLLLFAITVEGGPRR